MIFFGSRAELKGGTIHDEAKYFNKMFHERYNEYVEYSDIWWRLSNTNPFHKACSSSLLYPACEAAEAEKRLLWLEPIMETSITRPNDRVVFLNKLKASIAESNLSFLIWIRSPETSY